MNLGILYKPTNEYVSFADENGKIVLFTKDEAVINNAFNELLLADGGADDESDNFSIVSVDYPGDGNQYTNNEETVFVSASLVMG
mgnify:CR=1 FL=1